MEKKVHIVVHGGLVQAVYSEGVDVEVLVYDLDTDDNEEHDTLTTALYELCQLNNVNKVY